MARRKKPSAPAAFEPPAQLPETPEEHAEKLVYAAIFNELAERARADNMQTAIQLAQQAACGHGPLVDHFCELGRRYSHLLQTKPKLTRGDLSVLDGGRS